MQQQVTSSSKSSKSFRSTAASHVALQAAESQAQGQRGMAREPEGVPSNDIRPGLRKQASIVDPEQAKQLEKGWGLSYKDASAPTPVRKEVGMYNLSSLQAEQSTPTVECMTGKVLPPHCATHSTIQ